MCLDQSQSIEKVQKTCLKVILGAQYENYTQALDDCGLQSLTERRENKCLQFGLKCLVHPVHHRMFPVNPQVESEPYDTWSREHFTVNNARTDSYRMSTIPYIQRKLNDYVRNQNNQHK